MLGSGWRIGEGELRGGDSRAGSGVTSVETGQLNVAKSVWCAEEAFLSPPESGGPLSATPESEESSEDCEDYISGLAEEIAQSMLQEDEEASMKSAPRGIGVAKPAWSGHQVASSPTSPQSTLAGMEGYSWEERSPGGNVGSSGVSSPPTPHEGDAIDVLYAEILRVKLEDQVKLVSQQQTLSPQQQIIQRPMPLAASTAFSPDNYLRLDKFSAFQSARHVRSKGGGPEIDNYHFRGGSKQVGAAWGCGPFAQQNNSGKGIINNRREEGLQQYHQFSLFASNMESNGSNRSIMGSSNRKQEEGGMRAVFLGSTASRECGGTGVFLPRRPQDSKRKPDFLSSNSQWRRNPQGTGRRSKQKDEISSCYFPTSHSTTLQEVAPDISLPSEWTY